MGQMVDGCIDNRVKSYMWRWVIGGIRCSLLEGYDVV